MADVEIKVPNPSEVAKAIRVITDALGQARVDKVIAGIAMQALLDQLRDEGIEIVKIEMQIPAASGVH